MYQQDVGDLDDGSRYGLGTWLVPECLTPRVVRFMVQNWPLEKYDPNFMGQHLHTWYFDTNNLDLRKSRCEKDKYVTLRLRAYQPGPDVSYALSLKTESEKFRQAIPTDTGDLLSQPGTNVLNLIADIVPGNLLARLLDLTQGKKLVPVVMLMVERYAVESTNERLTLDVDLHTDTGKCFPGGILEFKSLEQDSNLPSTFDLLGLHPCKLSKFLWATSY